MVLRYVHRNPLEAGLVRSLTELAQFPWTGHSVLMGRNAAPFQSVDSVLQRFGTEPKAARERVVEWMGRAREPACRPNPVGGAARPKAVFGEPIHRDARILGRESVMNRVSRLAERGRKIALERHLAPK